MNINNAVIGKSYLCQYFDIQTVVTFTSFFLETLSNFAINTLK